MKLITNTEVSCLLTILRSILEYEDGPPEEDVLEGIEILESLQEGELDEHTCDP